MREGNPLKALIKKYGHIWTVGYIFIYMPWFLWLESRTVPYTSVVLELDEKIPFCEYFIIPYLLWFLYVPAVFIFLFFRSKTEYYRLCKYLFAGMTICLLICTIWPNGQTLRVDLTGHDNVFADIVRILYRADTNTNVFPSIHVFNSIGVHMALMRTQYLKKNSPVKWASGILMVLIILSTMFLKQHSIVDVAGAIVLAIVLYGIGYLAEAAREHNAMKIALRDRG